jgi:predicted Zn-ribbon and HTH transcriptional regulator
MTTNRREAVETIIQAAGASHPMDGRAVSEMAERVLRALKSDLVEQACAGAVVGRLPAPSAACDSYPDCAPCTGDQACEDPAIPIASVGPFVELAGDVARGLLGYEVHRGTCESCGGTGNRKVPLQRSRCPECDSGQRYEPPPFAAVYATLSDGSTEYVLVSAPCKTCGGDGASNGDVRIPGGCKACGGTGAEVNTKAVAARYSNGPETADNTAREARFRVRA